MKFHQIPVGTRFEFLGQVFTKTGPIAATSDQGGTRMIPRHAELHPIDGQAATPVRATGRKLEEGRVREAFEAFCQACRPLLADHAEPAFVAAKQAFLASLEGRDV